MKKLVSVTFEWKGSNNEFVTSMNGQTLVVKVGVLQLNLNYHLFRDDRGYYEMNENPPVFIKNLDKAKKRIENKILNELK